MRQGEAAHFGHVAEWEMDRSDPTHKVQTARQFLFRIPLK